MIEGRRSNNLKPFVQCEFLQTRRRKEGVTLYLGHRGRYLQLRTAHSTKGALADIFQALGEMNCCRLTIIESFCLDSIDTGWDGDAVG